MTSEKLNIDPEMKEIFEGFLIESKELLEAISSDLMELEMNSEDIDVINRCFRSFHTIKGTSAFMGFDVISGITHHAEDILNQLRRNEITVTNPIIDVLLEVHDWIALLLSSLEQSELLRPDFTETIAKIDALRNHTGAAQQPMAQSPEATVATNDQDSAISRVLSNKEMVSHPGDFTDEELMLLEEAFSELNSSFLNTISSENTTEQKPSSPIEVPIRLDSAPKPIPSVPSRPQSPQNVFEASAQERATDQAAKKDVKTELKGSSETIRVDVSRVETLMDLSGELVLGRNRLAQISDNLSAEFRGNEKIRDLFDTMAQIDFVTSEIQAAVMRMRMVPIAKLYQKAPRIVRDLAKEFGKHINLVLKGEETEIDRGIIEELNDPLVHMIRNSCDHGLEPNETRAQIGKPPTGSITLDAEQEGNAIVIRISDDGRGIDPERILQSAIEKKVITEEQGAQMSRRDILQLIFLPGFSTAKTVSTVSGRGVGMDVVKTNIQKLKGIIEIDSEIGKGTTFIIKLPLTLAIIQGVLVRVRHESYAIPLSSVIEVVAIEEKAVYSVNRQEVIRIRKEVLPLVRLDKVLSVTNPEESLKGRYVVVVGFGMQRIGFVVDELLGQQEIVIKSLGEYLGKIQGIAGSTILGDGRVVMIIDVAELVENYFHENGNGLS